MTYLSENVCPIINLKDYVIDNVNYLLQSHYSIWAGPFFLYLAIEQRNYYFSCSNSNNKGQSHHSQKNIPNSDVKELNKSEKL